MQTHYLGSEEVDAYLRDLAARLMEMGDQRPEAWVLIGPSGRELAKRLIKVEPQLDTSATAILVEYDRDDRKVSAHGTSWKQIRGKRVLVLDSSIHSGSTFQRVVEQVYRWGAKQVCSYALVMKHSSSLIPSFWGVTIADHDRAYFLLRELPNNHFHDALNANGQIRERPSRRAATAERTPYFHLRKLNDGDLNKRRVKSGTKSLDRVTWADRYYEMRANPERLTFILESKNQIYGYATIEMEDAKLHVEAIAVDLKAQGNGYGGALLRWAETFARQSGCRRIFLWGISKHVGMYEKFGYRKVDSQQIELDDGTYFLMTKPVLSHLS